MSDERKDDMTRWLVKAMSYMKTMYGNGSIPWNKEDEAMFQQIYRLIQAKPSDKDREELIRWLEDVYYSADEEFWGREEDKKKIWQIRQLIQQKPEIDKAYVEEKARGFYEKLYPHLGIDLDMLEIIEEFITQIISDTQGGNYEKPKG